MPWVSNTLTWSSWRPIRVTSDKSNWCCDLKARAPLSGRWRTSCIHCCSLLYQFVVDVVAAASSCAAWACSRAFCTLYLGSKRPICKVCQLLPSWYGHHCNCMNPGRRKRGPAQLPQSRSSVSSAGVQGSCPAQPPIARAVLGVYIP